MTGEFSLKNVTNGNKILTRFCSVAVNHPQSVVNHKQIVAICDNTSPYSVCDHSRISGSAAFGRHVMRTRVGSSAISRFAGAVTIGWLCGVGPAWAGGGGSDGGVSQPFLDQICQLIGIPTGSSPGSCIKPPTLTQIILGISGYQNTPPDFVRGPLGNVGSSNPCSVSGTPFPLCSDSNAVTTANPLAPSSIALSDLPDLTPLGFFSGPANPPANCPPVIPGQATPVPLGCANSFLYPVLTGPDGQHTLEVVFDYTPGTGKSFVKGQAVGSFTFPLVMLNSDNSETPVTATLNLTATCNG